MPATAANPVRPNVNSEGFKIEPAKLRAARFAIVDMAAAGCPELHNFPALTPLAVAIHRRRKGRGLQVVDGGQLAWGGGEDDAKPAITVTFSDREGDPRERITVLADGCSAATLIDELTATRPTSRRAA